MKGYSAFREIFSCRRESCTITTRQIEQKGSTLSCGLGLPVLRSCLDIKIAHHDDRLWRFSDELLESQWNLNGFPQAELDIVISL